MQLPPSVGLQVGPPVTVSGGSARAFAIIKAQKTQARNRNISLSPPTDRRSQERDRTGGVYQQVGEREEGVQSYDKAREIDEESGVLHAR